MTVRNFFIVIALLIGMGTLSSGIEWSFVRILDRFPQFRSSSVQNKTICLTENGAGPIESVEAKLRHDERFTPLAARIIGEPPDQLLQRFIVNVGSTDGVHDGNAVATPDGVYVGRVVAIRKENSIVAFVSSELHKVTVRIASQEAPRGKEGGRPLGILRGRGRVSAVIEYLDKNAAIASGATVVTSERETNIPAGLTIGTIDRIQFDATGVFQEATVSLPFAFNDLETVMIIRLPANSR